MLCVLYGTTNRWQLRKWKLLVWQDLFHTNFRTPNSYLQILNSKRRFFIHVSEMAEITSGYKNKKQLFIDLLCN